MFMVSNWISSKTYNTSDFNEVSYIINHKSNEMILLEGESSHIWNMLVMDCPYSDIIKYTESQGISNDLDNFISELLEVGLLTAKISNSEDIDFSSYSSNTNESENFLSEMFNFLDKNNYLPRLFLELTYNCNLNCIHCFNDKENKDKYISFKYIKPIIDEAIKLGIFFITISGGECTLNKDFLKIVEYIRKQRIAFDIFTNGQLLNDNEEMFNKLVSFYPYKISLSLYSMNPEIHDKITGVKGSQVKTLNVIKKLKEKNINVEIKVFLTNLNAYEYKDIEKFAKKNKISCTIDYTILNNPSQKNQNLEITEKQLTNILLDKESICSINNIIPSANTKTSKICNSGHTGLLINPDYNIYVCPALKILLGNCKENSLTQIWNNKDSNSQLGIIRNLRKKDLNQCYKKEYCKYCNYCPGIAASGNHYLKPYKVFCNSAKTKFKLKMS